MEAHIICFSWGELGQCSVVGESSFPYWPKGCIAWGTALHSWLNDLFLIDECLSLYGMASGTLFVYCRRADGPLTSGAFHIQKSGTVLLTSLKTSDREIFQQSLDKSRATATPPPPISLSVGTPGVLAFLEPGKSYDLHAYSSVPRLQIDCPTPVQRNICPEQRTSKGVVLLGDGLEKRNKAWRTDQWDQWCQNITECRKCRFAVYSIFESC